MKTDILGRAEIEILINSFYEKVKNDTTIGRLFAHVDWERHLPIMYSFWESTLFYTGNYSGNPMKTHQAFHEKNPLNPAHFTQWQSLFIATVDELFEGNNAELAKQRAMSISTVMQLKMFHTDGAEKKNPTSLI